MAFIEVTSKNWGNQKCLINIAHIERIEEKQESETCQLFLTGGKQYDQINESYKEVKEMILK